MRKIRWGILSTAKIGTEKVIPAMQLGKYCEVAGIASRELEPALAAAVQLGVPRAYGSYDELLAVFWENHDPTTMNRQGPDVGDQYRSAIFYHDHEQKVRAETSKEKVGKSDRYKSPIVTEITPASEFYPAEEHHQQYFEKRGMGGFHH